MYEKEIVAYMLKECGGLHPYYVSRIAALLDMEFLKEKGKKLTEFDYQKMQYGFYSTKIPEVINSLNVEKVEGENGKYMKLKDENMEIDLPGEIKSKINKILDEICDLSDDDINRKVIESPYYEKL